MTMLLLLHVYLVTNMMQLHLLNFSFCCRYVQDCSYNYKMDHFIVAGILDDQDLVETLKQSKGMAKEIYNRIAQSEEAEKRLSLARKRFLPVSI